MFLYKVVHDAVCITGCSNCDGVVRIPEMIEGYPVLELAPYAFSEEQRQKEQRQKEQQIAGGNSSLKKIYLPKTLRKIGKYAFYNCYELQSIYCSSTIADVGSGIFTGCTNIYEMDIQVVPGEKSCMKELLSELHQTVYVNYCEGSGIAKLVFPEMYEESVENTPAKFIMREMHGCGHLYRYCFEQTNFQFHKYDSLFPHVKAQEATTVVAALVMGRLQYPFELYETDRMMYETYLREHFSEAVKVVLADTERNIDSFSWLAKYYADSRELLDGMIEQTGRVQWTEGLSILMDLRYSRFGAKKRSFSL